MNKYTPQYILNKLKEKVEGNDLVLDKLSTLASIYTMCLEQAKAGVPTENLPNLSIFIAGNTGTGKTYSVETLSEILKIPMLRVDCSLLVPSGNDDGIRLDRNLRSWKEYTSNPKRGGILFLDELDKTSYLNSANNTEWKKSIQNSLLDVLTGKFAASGDYYKGMFSNLLIIGAGAFQSYKDTRGTYSKSIGFTENIDTVPNLAEHRAMLIEAGIIPELAGRFTDIVETEVLTKAQVRSLLFNVNSIYGKYLRLNNNVFFLEYNDVDDVIEKVVNSSSGLRELDTLIFNYFSDIIRKKEVMPTTKKTERKEYVVISEKLKHARRVKR